MQKDYDLIIHDFPQSLKSINIYPIGDTQVGSANFQEDLFEQWLEVVKQDDNGFIVIVGDMLNNGLKTSKTNSYREVMTPKEAKTYLKGKLDSVKDKIIGCVTGNHEERSISNTDNDPLEDIMEVLGKLDYYRENMAFLKMSFGFHKTSCKKCTYCIVLAHGVSKNKTSTFGYVIDGMDLFITGHTHDPHSKFPAKIRIDPRNNLVKLVDFAHIVVPSFDSFGGYALRGLYLPQSSYKFPVIHLNGEKKEVNLSWKTLKY